MVSITYRGPLSAVDVVLPDATTIRAVRGEPIEVHVDVARSLATQGDDEWERTPPNKKESD